MLDSRDFADRDRDLTDTLSKAKQQCWLGAHANVQDIPTDEMPKFLCAYAGVLIGHYSASFASSCSLEQRINFICSEICIDLLAFWLLGIDELLNQKDTNGISPYSAIETYLRIHMDMSVWRQVIGDTLEKTEEHSL